MHLDDIVNNFILSYGMISLFVLVLLEYIGIPFPSEATLPLIAIFINSGKISFTSAVIVSTLVGLLGSLISYLMGKFFKERILQYIKSKNEKYKKSLKTSIMYMRKYGKISMIIGRIMPVVRTFISIPAGASEMKISEFIIYSSIGIFLWNFFLIYLGYVLGKSIEQISYIMSNYAVAMSSIVIFIIACYFIKKKILNKK